MKMMRIVCMVFLAWWFLHTPTGFWGPHKSIQVGPFPDKATCVAVLWRMPLMSHVTPCWNDGK